MKHYRDAYQDNPYIHNKRPNIYVWRLHAPSGRPSKSMAGSREGWIAWYATNTPKTEQELEIFSPSDTGIRKGYTWKGPFLYKGVSNEV